MAQQDDPTTALADRLRDWLATNAYLVNTIPEGSIHITWDHQRITIKGPTRSTLIHLGQRPVQTRG